MTRELIVENCIRISQFFKSEYTIEGLKSEITLVAPSLKVLLNICGRILDYNGAPARNLSRIYITDEAFNDMINEAFEMGIVIDLHSSTISCGFNYYGYYWEVINEDAEKRYRQETLARQNKNNQ